MYKIRKSPVNTFILKFLINLHNFSYNWIKFFVVQNGKHPKHKILRYDKFFLDNIDKDNIILDIGCGNGHLTSKLAIKAKKIIAIDVSDKNIKVAKEKFQRNNIQFIIGDAVNYNFSQKFDIIILSNVLEHIEDRINFLKKLHKFSDAILIRVPMLNRDWLSVYKKEQGYEYKQYSPIVR